MFVVNQLDGQCFLELTEDDLKSIVKPLGVRMKLKALQKKVLNYITWFNMCPCLYVYIYVCLALEKLIQIVYLVF